QSVDRQESPKSGTDHVFPPGRDARKKRGPSLILGRSYGAFFRAAEQSLRAEKDHRDEQEKRDRRAVLGREVGGDEVIDDAQQQAAGDRAAHLVEAADDRRDERGEPEGL